jgi:hypothetical protein
MQIRENGGEISHVWDMKLWLSAAGLAALLLLQMGMKFVAVAQFFQHRDAIASALCVEREVPGSCGRSGGWGVRAGCDNFAPYSVEISGFR